LREQEQITWTGTFRASLLDAHAYLDGPLPRDELERQTPKVPERWPGSFVVDLERSDDRPEQ
jgi:hypothetical protein